MAKPGRPNFRPKMRTGKALISKPKRNQPDKTMYGDNWQKLSDYVKRRDDYTCQISKISPTRCGNRYAPPFNSLLHAHHIIPLPKGPNHPSNLITLCQECHGRIHNKYLGKITSKQKKASGNFVYDQK